MPEDRNEDLTNQTPESEGGDEGTESKDLDTLLKNHPEYLEEFTKKIQSEADRRVTQAMVKKEAEMKRREEEARARAEKEAKESRLLEDEKYKELADLRAKEAEEAKQELQRLQNERKVEALLEKREVHDPTLREIFKASNLDLEKMDEMITNVNKAIETRVDTVVNERLGGSGRPPVTGTTGEDSATLSEQIRKAEAKGDWATSLALKNQQMDLVHKRFQGGSSLPASGDIPSLEAMMGK